MIALLVISFVSFLVALTILLFVTLKIPHIIKHDMCPHSTNYAPVDALSTHSIDMTQIPVSAIDGVDARPGLRVLLKDQLDSRENGIWTFTDDMKWKRAWDMRKRGQLIAGATIYVQYGDRHCNDTYVLRILADRKKLIPGEIEIYFVPITEHIFGSDPPPIERLIMANEIPTTTRK